MLTSLKDNDGKIIAFTEWTLVGPSGYESESGEYIYIREIWVWPGVRNEGKIGRMIDEIMRNCPQAKHGYFNREKYEGRMKSFSREMWERRRKSYERV